MGQVHTGIVGIEFKNSGPYIWNQYLSSITLADQKHTRMIFSVKVQYRSRNRSDYIDLMLFFDLMRLRPPFKIRRNLPNEAQHPTTHQCLISAIHFYTLAHFTRYAACGYNVQKGRRYNRGWCWLAL